MRHFLRLSYATAFCTAVLGVLLAATPPAAGPPAGAAKALNASNYAPVGCGGKISGWDWVRAENAMVTWEFDAAQLAGCDVKKVHLNFAGLCTNGVNGGAGFDAKLVLIVHVGEEHHNESLLASNPFKPESPGDSKGVGYTVYGSSGPLPGKLVEKAIESGKLTVSLAFKDLGNDRHVAVNRGALFLGCVTGTGRTPGLGDRSPR